LFGPNFLKSTGHSETHVRVRIRGRIVQIQAKGTIIRAIVPIATPDEAALSI